MGKFIVFEGVDKSGKSTQILKVEEWLKEKGYNVIRLYEPGYTKLGNCLRGILKDKNIDCCPEAQKLLFMAARAQLITEELKPALIDNADPNTIVLCDRYALSTLCYQIIPEQIKNAFEKSNPELSYLYSIKYSCYESYKRQLDTLCKDLGFTVEENHSCTVSRNPDLNLIFNIDFDTWQNRGIKMNEKPDRFESQTEYIRQVIQNYKFVCECTTYKESNPSKLSHETFGPCHIIDARAPESIVEMEVKETIEKYIFK